MSSRKHAVHVLRLSWLTRRSKKWWKLNAALHQARPLPRRVVKTIINSGLYPSTCRRNQAHRKHKQRRILTSARPVRAQYQSSSCEGNSSSSRYDMMLLRRLHNLRHCESNNTSSTGVAHLRRRRLRVLRRLPRKITMCVPRRALLYGCRSVQSFRAMVGMARVLKVMLHLSAA